MLMHYLEAINDAWGQPRPWIFMAGGITNCDDWQKQFREQHRNFLSEEDRTNDIEYTLLNPRRQNFPINDPNASWAQISWEHTMLHKADLIMFWFAKGSLNPIVLFEYGHHLARLEQSIPPLKYIVVGADPEYARKQDVIIQTGLIRPAERPPLKVHETFEDFTRATVSMISILVKHRKMMGLVE